VVDASALGAMVFGEPGAEAVAQLLSKSTLVAPQLVWFELASIAFKKAARRAGDSSGGIFQQTDGGVVGMTTVGQIEKKTRARVGALQQMNESAFDRPVFL
jgi:PIN domain nuclease of toxin-antitoxin system